MQNFNFKPILFFSLFLISLGFLCYAVIKSERKKNKEYPYVIQKTGHGGGCWRTSSIISQSDKNISFIDQKGNQIFISGEFVITKNSNQ